MIRVNNLQKAFVHAYFKCLDSGIIPTHREVSKAIGQEVNCNARRRDSGNGGFSLSRTDFQELERDLNRLCDEKGCERFTVLTDDDEQASSWHKSIYATYCKLKEERSLVGLTYERFHSEVDKLHERTGKVELARTILEKDFSLLEKLRPQFSVFLKNLRGLARDFLYELEAERTGVRLEDAYVCSTYPLHEADNVPAIEAQYDTPHQLFVCKLGETSFKSATNDRQLAADAMFGVYSYPSIVFNTHGDIDFLSDAEKTPFKSQGVSADGRAAASSNVHSTDASQPKSTKSKDEPVYTENDILFAKMSLGDFIEGPRSIRSIRNAEGYVEAAKRSLSNETEVSNTLLKLLGVTDDDLKICWCYWKETKYGPRHYADFGNFKLKVEEVLDRKVSGKELLDALDKLEDVVRSIDLMPRTHRNLFVTNIDNLIMTEFISKSSYPHRDFDEFKNALLQGLSKYDLGDQLQASLSALGIGESEMIVLRACHHLKMFDATRRSLTQPTTKDQLVEELSKRGHNFEDLDGIILRVNNLAKDLGINDNLISFGLTPAQQILVPPSRKRALAEAV